VEGFAALKHSGGWNPRPADLGQIFAKSPAGSRQKVRNLSCISAIGFMMPRFYFHLTENETVHDDEGQYFETVEEARQAAIRAAREMLAESILDGEIDLIDRIMIADENGNPVLVVPFAETVTIRGPVRTA
jgi:hypothetical protein